MSLIKLFEFAYSHFVETGGDALDFIKDEFVSSWVDDGVQNLDPVPIASDKQL